MNCASLNKKYKIEPDQLMEWKRKTYEAPDVSNISKFKNVLNIKETECFQSIAGNLLDKFNYERI